MSFKGKSHTKEARLKISKSRRGKNLRNTDGFTVGHTPWNKETLNWIYCELCGGSRIVIPSRKGTQKYCSRECYYESKRGVYPRGIPRNMDRSGSNSPSWKGGVTPENKIQREKFRKEIQKGVFERDNYTCQLCHVRGGCLQVDHIQSWKDYVKLRFDINNCRTVCMKCHYKITFNKPMPENMKAWGHNFKHTMKGGH